MADKAISVHYKHVQLQTCTQIYNDVPSLLLDESFFDPDFPPLLVFNCLVDADPFLESGPSLGGVLDRFLFG